MFSKNIDFFAVAFIALAMLGFAGVRQLRVPEALDSIRFGNAINVDPCPTTQHVVTALHSILY